MYKSCMECMNLKVRKVDGSFKVNCKERGVKQKFFEKLEEIGSSTIDSATYTIAASKCVNYDPDIV